MICRNHPGRNSSLCAAAVMLVTVSGASFAQGEPAGPVESVLACQSIEDAQRRLACFDETSAALSSALGGGELTVIERATTLAVERESFGSAIGNPLRLFSAMTGGRSGTGDLPTRYEDGVEAVRTEDGEIDVLRGLAVRNVAQDPYGRLVVTLENGQIWRQTDSRRVPLPRAGNEPVTLEIRRGALGSFFMTLSYHSSQIRARRD